MLGKTLNFWEALKDGALPYAAIFGLVGLLVWVSLKFRSWYHNDSGLAADVDEMLLQFRDLRRRGDLTEEEFRSIKGRLVDDSAVESTTSESNLGESGTTTQQSAELQSKESDLQSGTDAKTLQGRTP